MRVKCIGTGNFGQLTKGKVYKVGSVEGNYYNIVDNDGDTGAFYQSRFELVEDFKLELSSVLTPFQKEYLALMGLPTTAEDIYAWACDKYGDDIKEGGGGHYSFDWSLMDSIALELEMTYYRSVTPKKFVVTDVQLEGAK